MTVRHHGRPDGGTCGAIFISFGAMAHRFCASIMRYMQALLCRLRAQPRSSSAVISADKGVDPEEAYLNAWLATPGYCYVSPDLFGLGKKASEARSAQSSQLDASRVDEGA